MDPQVRTSFIPKKPIESGQSVRRSGGIGILFFVALVLFLGSVVLAGGAFAYEKYLTQSITSKSDQLDRARAAFEPATIQDLMRLDDRLHYSKQILNGHVAPSVIFSLLSQSTLGTVSFSKLNYNLAPDGKATLGLEGSTKTFSEVALQSDEFGKLRALRDVLFSNFNVQDSGAVIFAVNATIDSGFILYRAALSQAAPSEENQTAPPPTTTP